MGAVILEVEKRTEIGTGRVNRLRKKAVLPAVVYGEGSSPLNIQLQKKDFMALIGVHKGESFVITLRIKDDKGSQDKAVLIKQIQHNPIKDDIIHVDFNEISLTKSIRVKVALSAKGEAVGVKRGAGVLDHILWELEVECLPTNMPENIEVDVSNLEIGSSIHVKDLILPAGVKALNDPDAAVLAVVMPTKEEPVPAAEEAAVEAEKAEPEVIKEKKEKAEPAAEVPGAKK